MTIRPAKARAPYVSDPLGGITPAPVDAQYVVMALDATLTQERVLTAGTGGISLVDGGAGGNATLNNTLTGANVGTGAGQVFRDKTAGPDVINLKTILAGSEISVTNNANDITIASDPQTNRIPTFADDFIDTKPFWDDTQAIQSGDWSIDVPNEYLQGDAENNVDDWIKRGIEGDVDYQFKVDLGTSTSIGIVLQNGAGTLEARFKRNNAAGNISAEFTGEGTVNVSLSDTVLWLRLTWTHLGRIDFWYKINDTDDWINVTGYDDKAMGHDKVLLLNSAQNGFIQRIILYDNMETHQIRGLAPKTSELTDAATIAIDASKANFFHVVLGGNRTLGAPTNPLHDGQMILVRVEQDGTGSRTLAFNAIYRFSTDLPSPTISTGAGQIDYLGFIYHESDDKWDYIAEVFGF